MTVLLTCVQVTEGLLCLSANLTVKLDCETDIRVYKLVKEDLRVLFEGKRKEGKKRALKRERRKERKS